MPLSNKQLDSIEKTDLQALIDNQVSEGKTIEYKRSLPGNTDKDKREFLADASSFANAAGGHLILGIKEKAGVPIELYGLENIDSDTEISRLENIIRDGIAPRIPGVTTRAVLLKKSRIAIIIRIPKSWAMPHMVTFKNLSRFYSRNSAGKYQLDVSELRAAFALSETTAERLRSFRAERLSKIVADETPVELNDGGRIVFHIIPFSAFDPTAKFDVTSLPSSSSFLQPLGVMGWSHRYNFDGLITHNQSAYGPATSYLQIFRNGCIEAVEADLLRIRGEGKGVIPSLAYEQDLLHVLPRYLSIQKLLGVDPPFFILLSLVSVSGYTLAVNPSRFLLDNSYPIDRDALILPEIVIESSECEPHEVMRPLFDAVWNAAGWPRSMNYNEDGEWVGQ